MKPLHSDHLWDLHNWSDFLDGLLLEVLYIVLTLAGTSANGLILEVGLLIEVVISRGFNVKSITNNARVLPSIYPVSYAVSEASGR